MIASVPEEAYTSGVLNKEFHDRLIRDIDVVSESAGIPPKFLWSKMSEMCQEADIEWVKSIPKSMDHGLVMVGSGFKKADHPVTDRMMAMAGAFLRNYIEAKVMPLQDVLTALKNDSMPSPTILLIPNFCLANTDGGSVAPWQIGSLLGLLYSRLSRNQKTVVFVSSIECVEKAYGESFKAHFQSHFAFA